MKDIINQALIEARGALEQFTGNPKNIRQVERAAELMSASFKTGNKIYSAGNGGSMCDAMHFAEELSGRFRDNRKPLPAIAISDPGYLSCVANDYGFDQVFSRFLQAHAKVGDIFLAISTSGKSPNILNAARMAKEMGVSVIALTGTSETELTHLADIVIAAPGKKYADRVQELHIKIIHILIECIEHSLGLTTD